MARERFSTAKICRGTDYERTHRVYFKESEMREDQKSKRYEELKNFHEENKEELSLLFNTVTNEKPERKSDEIPLDMQGWMPMFGVGMQPMTYGQAKTLKWEDKWSPVKYR